MNKKLMIGLGVVLAIALLIGSFYLGSYLEKPVATKLCATSVLSYQTTTCKAVVVINNQITELPISGCTPAK